MAKWTFILIGICVLVFVLQQTNIFDWESLAFTPALAFQRPWTFITSMFMHAGLDHLFFNMFALFLFGMVLENKIGAKHFLIIYFISGIAGGIGYMITATDPSIPALGASGAIYGLLATLAILMPLMVVYVYFIPMPMIAAAIVWVALELLGVFSTGSGIAHGAHLGGLFVGFVYGAYLRLSERKRTKAHFFAGYNW